MPVRHHLAVGLLLGLLLFATELLAAGLEARLDRNRVAEGEAVVLTLRASGDLDGAPDFSPLAREFDLLNQGQSSRMQFINGRSSSWREWQLTLAPRRLGKLQIPALQLGGERSQPIELEVVEAAELAKDGPLPPVMLEVETSTDKPYVQGKVVYTVRVLTRAPLRQANLDDPRASDALIERLGADRESETYRNGQSYRVIERRYAVFPQRSGSLEIDPPTLSAQLPDNGNRGNSLRDRMFGGRDPFADLGGMFSQGQPVRLRARRVTLDVQPQPPGTPTPWLPAESLVLNEAWSPNPPAFRVGEPVTRSIVITAQGMTGAQLPDVPQPAIAGISVYPDKPQVSTRAEGDTLIAQRVMKSALVPERAGSFMLPAIELAWWDARNGRQQVARIPAREVTVAAGATGGTAAPPPRVSPQALPGNPPAMSSMSPGNAMAPNVVPGTSAAPRYAGGLGFWPWLTAVFALAWLISMAAWWRARAAGSAQSGGADTGSKAPTASAGNVGDPGKALDQFEQACRASDARGARQALLAWAAANWPADPPQRLDQLARHLPDAAGSMLAEIDRALFAADAGTWHGDAAWQALSPLLSRQRRPASTAGEGPALPPLYPGNA